MLPLRLAQERLRTERVFADLAPHNRAVGRRGRRVGSGRRRAVVDRVDLRRALATPPDLPRARRARPRPRAPGHRRADPPARREPLRPRIRRPRAGPGRSGSAPAPSSTASASTRPTSAASPPGAPTSCACPSRRTSSCAAAAPPPAPTISPRSTRWWPGPRRCGVYTLLDLQWIDAETPRGIGQDGSINRVPSLPDGGSIEVWRILASRYRDRPSVLFDLFNEPHTPMQTDDAPLVGIRPDGGLWRLPARVVGMDEWQPWALRLVAEIRAVHPHVGDLRVRRALGLRPARLPAAPALRAPGRGPRLQHARLPVDDASGCGPAAGRSRSGTGPSATWRRRIRSSRGSGAAGPPTSTGAAGCSPISRRRRWAGRRGAGATGRRCWPTTAPATGRRRRSGRWCRPAS